MIHTSFPSTLHYRGKRTGAQVDKCKIGYTYSPFLSPAELATLAGMREELSFADYETFGGHDMCERQMVAFGSERMFRYVQPWPVRTLRIAPLSEKFADVLTHRDFLGALMNLGIERAILGDILVKEHTCAYVFSRHPSRISSWRI